ncbi:MAG: HEAT repeat domain-containing protein [Coriobacteriaceae bacterium]|jgi:epoxyqueuosine reductase|nr:HEAT repeat domain-containing protein [Coriobacteriaceae bacterium]
MKDAPQGAPKGATAMPLSLGQRIKEYALDIGYTRVGFTPADDFEEYLGFIGSVKEDYDWWIEGAREPLEWARPTRKVPDARSIIVLVYDYAQKRFPPQLCARMGRVYQSRSYLAPPSNINGARMELLKLFLAEQGVKAVEAVWLPQRWAAQRAGLAFFGKNTFAYAPGLGSFIVISTLLVDAVLEYDQPSPIHGCPDDCTRCLDACPTHALYQPYRLNPRRCLAFNAWMPMVGNVAHDIRKAAGGRIHGCDLCQEACPRNQAILKGNDARPRDSLLELLAEELTLEQVLHLDPGYYESRVYPVMYNYIRNLDLFKRNAAIAIGNSHDPRYLPDLAIELENPSSLVRCHVAWALGQIGGQEAADLLRSRKGEETDEEVCEEIRLALDLLG